MQLVLDSDPRINVVRRYDPGVVVVGELSITAPCLITPTQMVLDWPATSVASLTTAQLAPALELKPQILLLGEGTVTPWPTSTVRAWLRERQVALECMNLGAACRTYNVLAHESRLVVVGLFP